MRKKLIKRRLLRELIRVDHKLSPFLEEGLIMTIGSSEYNRQSAWYPLAIKSRDIYRIIELLNSYSVDVVINAMKVKIEELKEVENYRRAAMLHKWVKELEKIPQP